VGGAAGERQGRGSGEVWVCRRPCRDGAPCPAPRTPHAVAVAVPVPVAVPGGMEGERASGVNSGPVHSAGMHYQGLTGGWGLLGEPSQGGGVTTVACTLLHTLTRTPTPPLTPLTHTQAHSHSHSQAHAQSHAQAQLHALAQAQVQARGQLDRTSSKLSGVTEVGPAPGPCSVPALDWLMNRLKSPGSTALHMDTEGGITWGPLCREEPQAYRGRSMRTSPALWVLALALVLALGLVLGLVLGLGLGLATAHRGPQGARRRRPLVCPRWGAAALCSSSRVHQLAPRGSRGEPA